MKMLTRYLAQNALLIALIIIASYQQYQLLELSKNPMIGFDWLEIRQHHGESEYAGHYAKAAYDEALTARIKAASNSDRLITIEAGLTVGTFQTNCSN